MKCQKSIIGLTFIIVWSCNRNMKYRKEFETKISSCAEINTKFHESGDCHMNILIV